MEAYMTIYNKADIALRYLSEVETYINNIKVMTIEDIIIDQENARKDFKKICNILLDIKDLAKKEQAQDDVKCKIFNPTDRDNIKALTDEVDDLKELVAKLANKVTKNESRIGRVEGQIIKDK